MSRFSAILDETEEVKTKSENEISIPTSLYDDGSILEEIVVNSKEFYKTIKDYTPLIDRIRPAPNLLQNNLRKIKIYKIRTYFANGNLFLESNHKAGRKHGLKTRYYNDGKTIELQEMWHNDKKHGRQIEYSRESRKVVEVFYKKGKKHGKKRVYYPSFHSPENLELNNVEIEENYVNGKKQGKFTYFYRNGSVEIEGKYENDKLHGEWIERDTKGNIKKIKVYENDRLITTKNFEKERDK